MKKSEIEIIRQHVKKAYADYEYVKNNDFAPNIIFAHLSRVDELLMLCEKLNIDVGIEELYVVINLSEQTKGGTDND